MKDIKVSRNVYEQLLLGIRRQLNGYVTSMRASELYRTFELIDSISISGTKSLIDLKLIEAATKELVTDSTSESSTKFVHTIMERLVDIANQLTNPDNTDDYIVVDEEDWCQMLLLDRYIILIELLQDTLLLSDEDKKRMELDKFNYANVPSGRVIEITVKLADSMISTLTAKHIGSGLVLERSALAVVEAYDRLASVRNDNVNSYNEVYKVLS